MLEQMGTIDSKQQLCWCFIELIEWHAILSVSYTPPVIKT